GADLPLGLPDCQQCPSGMDGGANRLCTENAWSRTDDESPASVFSKRPNTYAQSSTLSMPRGSAAYCGGDRTGYAPPCLTQPLLAMSNPHRATLRSRALTGCAGVLFPAALRVNRLTSDEPGYKVPSVRTGCRRSRGRASLSIPQPRQRPGRVARRTSRAGTKDRPRHRPNSLCLIA